MSNAPPRRRYKPRRLVLRARALMAERGVTSAVALHALLVDAGVDISHSQLTRILNNESELLNIHVINGLMTVLRCDADELFETRSG